jgi:FkbM family methyltransferase
MKFARKVLVKILGLKGYLRLVSKTYIAIIGMGWMRKKYAELYFVKRIIKKDDTVLDIGANLGYYSFFMSVSAGKEGKLLAVEPIPLFADVWKKNMCSLKKHNIKLFNCALGKEEQEKVKMSIPIVNGVVRHGLTKVVEEGDANEAIMSFDVPMKIGDNLVESENISQLNFIKCDVEGYEQYVIPSLKDTIVKYQPLIQIELSGEDNRQNVVDYLVNLSYDIFILKDNFLHAIQKNDIFNFNQDFYFVHQDKLEERKYLIRN